MSKKSDYENCCKTGGQHCVTPTQPCLGRTLVRHEQWTWPGELAYNTDEHDTKPGRGEVQYRVAGFTQHGSWLRKAVISKIVQTLCQSKPAFICGRGLGNQCRLIWRSNADYCRPKMWSWLYLARVTRGLYGITFIARRHRHRCLSLLK